MNGFNLNRDISALILEAQNDIKNVALNGNPHDDFSNGLAKVFGASLGLLESEIKRSIRIAVGDYDDLHGVELNERGLQLGGLHRRAKTQSRGFVKIKSSTQGSIPTGITFASNGVGFVIDNTRVLPNAFDVNGFAYIPIVSNTYGLGSNVLLGSAGVVSVNNSQINRNTLEIYASGGYDEETDEEYRTRLKFGDKLSKAPNSTDWLVFRTLRYPNILRACVSNCNCCPNEVDLYILAGGFDNYIPNAEFIAQVQNDVFGTEIGKSEYGSKTNGVKVNIYAPVYGSITVNVYGGLTLTNEQRNLIQNELRAYIQNSCVGNSFCKSDINNILSLAGKCSMQFALEYDKDLFDESDTHLNAKCNVLTGILDVCFKS